MPFLQTFENLWGKANDPTCYIQNVSGSGWRCTSSSRRCVGRQTWLHHARPGSRTCLYPSLLIRRFLGVCCKSRVGGLTASNIYWHAHPNFNFHPAPPPQSKILGMTWREHCESCLGVNDIVCNVQVDIQCDLLNLPIDAIFSLAHSI